MKKLFIAIASIFILASCTENQRVREFGGEMTVNLPKGQKLLRKQLKEKLKKFQNMLILERK